MDVLVLLLESSIAQRLFFIRVVLPGSMILPRALIPKAGST